MAVRSHTGTLGEANGRKFDRLVEFDDDSRLFPIRAVLAAPVKVTQRVRHARLWTPGPLLDQGEDGACTGFGSSGELGATPVKLPVDNPFAFNLYHEAQKRDPWKDHPHEGSTVLAAMKACQDLGLISSYHWAFSIDDVIDALVFHSPAVFGTVWLNSMFDVDADGCIVIDPSSGDAGGHCYYVFGWFPVGHHNNPLPHKEEEIFVMRQSWGPWGKRGDGVAYMRRSGVEYLLRKENDAEVAVPTDLRRRVR